MPSTLSSLDRDRLREALSEPGLQRLLGALRDRWVRNGRAAGQVIVETPEEALALGGLTGRRYRSGVSAQVQRIEEDFRSNTRFGCSLKEALEVHFGVELVADPERRRAREAAWETARAELTALLAAADLRPDVRVRLEAWLESSTRDFRSRHTRDRRRLRQEFRLILRAIALLPEGDDAVTLAALAYQATGDSHSFDTRGSMAGLFDQTLAALHPEVDEPMKRGAEGRDDLLAAAGIVKDRTSAKVDVFGLVGSDPALAYLAAFPLQSFSLRALEMVPNGLRAAADVAYVVENASVFDYLVERLQHLPAAARPTLVCTNGRMNLADRRLLRALVDGGARVRYSGDFDGGGLSIAAEVLRRFSPRAELWRMGVGDYRSAVHGEAPSLTGRLPGADVVPADLIIEMQRVSRVAYQEALQNRLLDDLLGE